MPTIIKQLPRKVLAINLDQTLAHTLEALVDWHNQIYKTQFTLRDFNTYDFSQVWGGTQEETYEKIRRFYNSQQFENIKPIEDFGLEALKMLKKRQFTLVIITSRQQFIAGQTKLFVDRHYPGLFESIYFCNLGLSASERLEYISKSKATICKEANVDILIDDSLEHALDCAKLGIDVLLYDRSGKYTWNHIDSAPTALSNTHSPLTSIGRKPHPLLSIHKSPLRGLPSNVKRMTGWKDIMIQLSQPRSPLSMCYYPEDFIVEGEEEEEEEEEEDFYDGSTCVDQGHGYETIEIDEFTEDDIEDVLDSKNRYADDAWNDTIVWV
ncbi:hypothetical protein BDF14DRAFT_1880324 [Spinellus fusiger]|nr:hypothetical protein BDF14DRAFT_1880324 [Spinellus fusiger]